MTLQGDTIAAIATAPGRGGVAVIRVSGPDAFAIAEALTGRRPTPGRIAFAKFRAPAPTHASADAFLDEGILLTFKSPHSYTGEDVIELQCHGGTMAPRRVLQACFAAGARLAERGEFTSRAFLNGRIGLEAAQGVIDLIDAKTDRAADAALAEFGGVRMRRHHALYERALEISTTLEHALDVDESDLPDDFVSRLVSQVRDLRNDLARALARLREGKILRDGARVVLAGAPNAGKSSLLNALLGERRAIVSATPGTTRDAIEEWLDIAGWPVRLTDTAGLRGTDDAIEAEGVARAEALIANADLVLALDCDIPGAIRIHAKCDLDASDVPPPDGLRVSAKTGVGLDALRLAIAARLEAHARQTDEPSSDGERDAALLAEARAALYETDDVVLLANAVRACAETLGRLVGARYSDDLLDTLFSRFCVGK